MKTHPEAENEIREEASHYRTTGSAWYVEGLDGTSDTEIVELLQGVGIETNEKSFREQAEVTPGPIEIAGAWEEQARFDEAMTRELLELSARALWKKWAPEVPCIESAADRLESLLHAVNSKDSKDVSALSVVHLFTELSEGDEDVAEAISAELPMRIWPWILDRFRFGDDVIEPPSDWLKAGEVLVPIFPSLAILEGVMGRFAAKHGVEDEAKDLLQRSLEHGGNDSSFVLVELAIGYADLDEDGLATTLAEKALILAEDEEDEKDACVAIRKVCERAGRSGEAEEQIHAAKKRRMELTLSLRRDRRRKGKKGKGKGKRR